MPTRTPSAITIFAQQLGIKKNALKILMMNLMVLDLTTMSETTGGTNNDTRFKKLSMKIFKSATQFVANRRSALIKLRRC